MRSNSFLLFAVVIFAGTLVQACFSGGSNTNIPPVADSKAPQKQKENEDIITSGQWRPAEACDFLSEIGLRTRGYKDLFGDGEYTCSSDYKEIGTNTPFANDIAYYAYGTSGVVKKLKIVLNVKAVGQRVSAHNELQRASSALTQKAIGVELPNTAVTSINQGKPGRWMVGGYSIEVTREEWSTGKGYEIHFTMPSPLQ
ncbi:MAG: hypothetical protein QM785_19235 [Pyrinomonadaceae bacterium]